MRPFLVDIMNRDFLLEAAEDEWFLGHWEQNSRIMHEIIMWLFLFEWANCDERQI